MTDFTNHTIKVNRAISLAQIGEHPASAAAMLDAVPADVIDALPARLIAQLLDANWKLAQASKAIATRDAIAEGVIWDAQQQRHREISQ